MKIKNLDIFQGRFLRKSKDLKSINFNQSVSIVMILLGFFMTLNKIIKGNDISIFFVIVLVSGILSFGITKYLKNKIIKELIGSKDGRLKKETRKKAILGLVMLLFGNIFGLFLFLNISSEEDNVEYKLSYLIAFLFSIITIISSLNIFKSETVITQLPVTLVVGVLAIVSWIMVPLVKRNTTQNKIDKKMKKIGIMYLLFTLTGNIFSLILGIIIIKQVNNQSNKEITSVSIIKRLFRNPTAIAGMVFILFLMNISILSPFLFNNDLAILNDYTVPFEKPSLQYLLGTDNFGRDLFSRIMFGARISLIIGFISTIIPIIIGGILGLVAGYFGSKSDNIIMRILDILYAIPGILLAIAIIAAFGANTLNLILALSIGGIPGYARITRAQVMQLSDAEFIEASRALGVPTYKILTQDIAPNILSPIIVRSTLSVGGAVLATSSLSYLGIGIQAPTPEWGSILKDSTTYLQTNPHIAIVAGLSIMLVVLAFNFFGDGLRDALDPKMK